MAKVKWVIRKSSRWSEFVCPYSGPSCDQVGIPEGKIYLDKAEAERDATLLSKYNPVGFVVVAVVENQLGQLIEVCPGEENEAQKG